MKISKEMRRVLRFLGRRQWATPKDCRCNYRTFVALEQRGLIRVATTIASIVSPHDFAEAYLTEAGKLELKRR
ncbi:MAG: hypothetical protein AB7R40_23690 [Nitrospiraceae bacterium]